MNWLILAVVCCISSLTMTGVLAVVTATARAGEQLKWATPYQLAFALSPFSLTMSMGGGICDRQNARIISHREFNNGLIAVTGYKSCGRIVVTQRIVGDDSWWMSCIREVTQRDPKGLGRQIVASRVDRR